MPVRFESAIPAIDYAYHASHDHDHGEPNGYGHPDDTRGTAIVQAVPGCEKRGLPSSLHDREEAYDGDEVL